MLLCWESLCWVPWRLSSSMHKTIVKSGVQKFAKLKFNNWRHNTQHTDVQHNDTEHYDTQNNDTQHYDIQHNDTKHNFTKHKNKNTTLTIANFQHIDTSYCWYCYSKFHYAECLLCRVPQRSPILCWVQLIWMLLHWVALCLMSLCWLSWHLSSSMLKTVPKSLRLKILPSWRCMRNATTLSIMTLSIMTLSIMTLSIMTLSIMTLSRAIKKWHSANPHSILFILLCF
jgi:hypothetical protein